MAEIQWREPEIFTAGDSLRFQRNLPDYLPSAGWAIRGTLTKLTPNGSELAAQYTSAADSTGQYHVVTVDNFAHDQDEGDYILSEEVFNGAEQHKIYYGQLTLVDNLGAGASTGVQTTHAQRMIPLLEAKIEEMELNALDESDVARTKFITEKRNAAVDRLKYYKELRNYELKMERAANTGIDQNYIRPTFVGGW